MAAGSIVVDLLLKTGSFETDTVRASKALKQLQRDAESIGRGIGVGLVAAVGGLAYLVKSTIDADDHLNDLSKSTGVAVETLGGIGFAAKQAGGDVDSAAAALGKLNQTLGKAASDNEEAIATLKALGVDALDPLTGKTITVDKALVQLADTFSKSGDSPEKFRLAAQALGKQYAALVPLLADGGKALLDNIAYYQKYSGVSKDTAEKADAFNDTLSKIKLLSGAFAQTLVAELLPPLQGLANLWVENKEKGDQFKGVAADIATVFKGIAFGALAGVTSVVAFGKALGGTLAAIDAAKNFQFGEALKISKETLADIGEAKDRVASLYDTIYNPAPAKGDAAPKPNLKIPTDTAAGSKAQAALKAALEGQIRTIQEFGKQQDQAFQYANAALDGTYSAGLLSLRDFFAEENSLRDAQTRERLRQIDQTIAIEKKLASGVAGPVAAEAAKEKIKQLQIDRASLVLKNSQDIVLADQKEVEATRQLADAYANLKASVLSLQGDDFGATSIKNAQQVRDARKLILQAGGDPAQADELAKQLNLQAQLAQITKDYSLSLGDLSNQEARVALAQQTGALTSLDALIRVGQIRKAQIPVLEAQVEAEEAIAKASGNTTLIQNAENARLALEKLKASADPLAESLNKTFGDDLTSSLSDFVTGTKSAADAFHSFTNAVLNDILKLGAKSISESLIGGSGGLGGVLSQFLGSGSSSGNVQGIGGKYNGSQDSGGLVAGLASLFSGFFADGGTIPPGQWGVVGERGPEPAYGGSTGLTVQPGGGGTTNHINVQIQATPGMSRDTAMQQGAAYGQGIQKALARNG